MHLKLSTGEPSRRVALFLLGLAILASPSASQETKPDTSPILTAERIDVQPTLLRLPPVNYPDSLRRAGVGGLVVVHAVLDTSGHPESTSVRVIGSPDSALAALARARALGSRFSAALVGCHRVRTAIDLQVEYDPRDKSSGPQPVYGDSDSLTERPKYVRSLSPPEYPQVLQRRQVRGRVLVQMIIDTVGRVEKESVQIIKTPDPGFIMSVSRFLTDVRFRPGRRNGHAVRTIVWFPIDFKLYGVDLPFSARTVCSS